MRVDDFYIAGLGGYLPDAIPVSEAISNGDYDPQEAAANKLRSITVEPELSAPEMAVRAGRAALAASNHAPAEIGLLLHATCYRQGPEIWPAASYVERYAVGSAANAIEIRQGCNGALAGLELAVGYLRSHSGVAAMITAADHAVGDIDRWRSDYGVVFGDGAAAVVLSERPGIARLRSIVSRTDPELEEMHRGDQPLTAAARYRGPVDVRSRKKSYLARFDFDTGLVFAGARKQLCAAVDEALRDADTTMGQVDLVALPHLGFGIVESNYLDALDIALDRTTWPWGSGVGHLGASDQIVALNHFLENGTLTAGDHVLVVGAGIGFTWSAAVIEIL